MISARLVGRFHTPQVSQVLLFDVLFVSYTNLIPYLDAVTTDGDGTTPPVETVLPVTRSLPGKSYPALIHTLTLSIVLMMLPAIDGDGPLCQFFSADTIHSASFPSRCPNSVLFSNVPKSINISFLPLHREPLDELTS